MAETVQVITSAKDVGRLIAQKASHADAIWIASAWACLGTAAASALSKHAGSIKHLVVGLDFHQTDPEFLKRFQLVVRVRLSAEGTFHPKVYVFRKGRSFDAIVGSSNFTRGGLDGNVECNLHVSGNVREPSFKRLTAFVEQASADAKMLSSAMLRAYRTRYEELRPERDDLQRLRLPEALIDDDAPALDVPWSRYVRRLRQSGRRLLPTADSLGYVGTTEAIRNLFRRWPRFAEMPREARRKVAGIDDRFLHFGSMRGAGSFMHLVDEQPKLLAKALDRIAATGQVDRLDFDGFVRALPPAGVGLATSTRLLAMKRPDLFLCVDSKNVRKLHQELGHTLSGRDRFERYWMLLERIWKMPWCQAPRPRRPVERRLWNARVALLDVFYYDRDG